MIRFSALNLARHCGHAARLNEQHPESSEAALHGRERHRLIAGRLNDTIPPCTYEGVEVAVRFAHDAMLDAGAGAVAHVEKKVSLYGEDGSTIITEGTPDLVIVYQNGFIHIVDWKSRLDGVESASENLQGIG